MSHEIPGFDFAIGEVTDSFVMDTGDRTPPSSSASVSEDTARDSPPKKALPRPRLNSIRQTTDHTQVPFDIEFLFMPTESDEVIPRCDWEAALQVCTNDLPGLMKDGFCWDSKNVCMNKNKMVYIDYKPPEWRSSYYSFVSGCQYYTNGWPVARRYELEDRSWEGFCGRKKWTATLWVRAQDVSILSKFRIDKLTVDNCCNATAWSTRTAWGDERSVDYYYNSEHPEYSYNVFYDDAPVKGWWPWPKQESAPVAEANKGLHGDDETTAGSSSVWRERRTGKMVWQERLKSGLAALLASQIKGGKKSEQEFSLHLVLEAMSAFTRSMMAKVSAIYTALDLELCLAFYRVDWERVILTLVFGTLAFWLCFSLSFLLMVAIPEWKRAWAECWA